MISFLKERKLVKDQNGEHYENVYEFMDYEELFTKIQQYI